MQFLDLLILSGAASAGVAGGRRSKHDHIVTAPTDIRPTAINSKPGSFQDIAHKLAYDAHKALSAGAPFKSQRNSGEEWSSFLAPHEPVTQEHEVDSSAPLEQAWPKVTHGIADAMSSAQIQWDAMTEGVRSRTSEAVEMAKAQLTASERPWPTRAATPHDVLRRTGDDIGKHILGVDDISSGDQSQGEADYHAAPRPRARPSHRHETAETRAADPTPAPTISTVEPKTAPMNLAAANITAQMADHPAYGHPTPAAGVAAVKTAS